MRRLYNSKLMVLILLLAFFKPICLQYYSNLKLFDLLYNVYKTVAVIIIVLQSFFARYPRVNLSNRFFAIFIFGLWSFVITVISKGYVARVIIDFATIYAIYIFIDNGLKNNSKRLIEQAAQMLLVLIVLQLVTELIYPTGMPADLYNNNLSNPLYFMTLDNGTASLTIMAITFIYLRDKYCKKRKSALLIGEVLICITTAILSGSTTAMLCTIFMALVPPLVKIMNKHSSFDKPITWIGLYLVLFVFVIIGGSNSTLILIVSMITGKVGFTGRTFLWESALELIEKSPVIGYGRQATDYIKAWGGYFSSHNVILEAMLQGGIVEVVLWINCIIHSTIPVKTCEDKYLTRILLSSMFITLVSLLMETTVFSVYLFTILALLGNCNYIVKTNKYQ